tara:strand:- start:1143 stop:1391 length:249 start_codon:yes stop_codon:yes gene_type:complete
MATANEVKDQIDGIDTLSVRNGVYTARRGFFYRHGKTSQHIVDKITWPFPTATIIDHGEVWKAFNGGAPVSKQSHWWVKFTL